MTGKRRTRLGRYGVRALFHITHCRNAGGIARNGILSHRLAHEKAGPVDISDPEVQDIREDKRDPIHGRPLHDYAPLYFRARNPMLYVRKAHQDELVILCASTAPLFWRAVVFTDGNAASAETEFFDDVSDLEKLDWVCLNARYWNNFEDGKRKRCAEVLVPDSLAPRWIRSAVVRTDHFKRRIENDCPWTVRVKPDWFF